jgi:acetoacetyl-CoA synthetase
MVHRAGGVLLNHHKEHSLHCDIKRGDRVLYYTTCGWMMWNWLVSVLAQGATIVLYEGSPGYPSLHALWEAVERQRVSHFGTSARFIHSCKAASLTPNAHYPFKALQSLLSTGSPLSPAGFRWVYEEVKADLHLASISGGTDIVGCFMLGDPTAPVYAGQIQVPGLGVDLAAFNDSGEAVYDEPGELVCRKPLPSMPIKFWKDDDFSRYKAAYFERYPGVWRHGDLIEIKKGQGIVVYGRSDATLNPGGVRIGTAEIYRPLETLPEVTEALAVGKREENDETIWLFVVLREGMTLDAPLKGRIQEAIRSGASPRHVPRRVFQVSGLPRTRSGKAMEIAVSRLVNGKSVPNLEVIANPEVLDEIALVLEP